MNNKKCKQAASGHLFNLHGTMGLLVLACTAAPIASFAETTWYWKGVNVDGDSHYLWQGLNNWTNEYGEAGDPARGDNVVLFDNTCPTAFNVCNSIGDDTASNSKRVALNSIVFDGYKKSCNQGNFALIGGGAGLKVLGDYKASHYTGILLEGEGDVPFDIVEAGSEFRGQMRMVARKDPDGKCSPALVKKGLGTLISFYNTGNKRYEFPMNKIQQGTLDVTLGATLSNVEFRFDGNDGSARLAWGYPGKIPLTLGTGCAITESADVNNTEHGFHSKYDLQLQITGTPTNTVTTFTGTFYGGAGLLWDPSSTEYSFVYSKGVSATTGRVDVVKGTLSLVNGASFTALSGLKVSADGTLSVESGSGANFRAETLDLVSGCKLNLGSGVVLTVHAATLDTLPVLAGTYAASAGDGVTEASWIEGDGTVVIETGSVSAARWTGGAGDSNGIAVGGNWSPSLPDLDGGSTFAVFADGGSSANIDRDVYFNGLSLKGGFDFTGYGTLNVGDNGASTLDAASEVAYGFNCTVGIPVAQSWVIGANNIFNVNAGLSGEGSMSVSGDGTLNIGGTSSWTGPINIGTKTTVSGVNALGAAGTLAKVRNDSGALCFSSATNDAAVSFYNVGAPSPSTLMTCVGHSVFNGPVTNEMTKIEVPEGASVEFAQVYKGNEVRFKGDGNVIFRGKMEMSGSSGTFYLEDDVTVDFHTANNSFALVFWTVFSDGCIRCRTPYALKASGRVNAPGESKGQRFHFKAPAVLDLGGFDQSLDGVCATGGGTVTSEDPAFFHWVAKNPYNTTYDPDGGNIGRTNNLVFAGAAGLSYDGAQTNRLGAVSTTTGTLQVTQGKLIILPQASWLNSTNVVVSGGILAVENAEAFNGKESVSISGDGLMDLDFDGTLRCNYLYIDGQRMSGGIYGSADSPATRKDAHFLGRGVICALLRGSNFILR